ncbi:MAG: hypothetical protein ABIG95_07165 [Candidatus Woesearchaeota archaeon]
MKKAIIFSLDALVSLVVAIVVVFTLFRFMGTNYQPRSQRVSIGADILALFERSNIFTNLVATNDSFELQMQFDYFLPSSLCGRITIFNQSLQIHEVNLSCWNNTNPKSVAYRTFIYQKNPYYARMEISPNE